MDIINEYIESKDVRKYLKDIDYKLSMLQAFMLVWRKKEEIALKDMMNVCKYIAENFDDMKVRPRARKPELEDVKSLKNFILDYIKANEEDLECFKNNINGETYIIMEDKKEGLEFKNYNECYEYLLKNKENYKNKYYIKVRKKKKNISDTWVYECDNIIFDKNINVKRIDIYEYYGKSDNVRYESNEFYFELPCPFNRGDIVRRVGEGDNVLYQNKYKDYSIYCIDAVDSWNGEKCIAQGMKDPAYIYDRILEKDKRSCGFEDSLNFTAYEYHETNFYYDDSNMILLPDGQLNRSIGYSYQYDNPPFTEMEFVDEKEIVGKRRIVYLFREYLKYDKRLDKIMPIEKLLQVYDYFKGENDELENRIGKKEKDYKSFLTNEWHDPCIYYFENYCQKNV